MLELNRAIGAVNQQSLQLAAMFSLVEALTAQFQGQHLKVIGNDQVDFMARPLTRGAITSSDNRKTQFGQS